MNYIPVRENARLTMESNDNVSDTFERASIPKTAFDYLCQLRTRPQSGEPGNSLFQLESQDTLRLDSYVGFIQTPCGTQIEVLPKILNDVGDIPRARTLLQKMLQTALNLPRREVNEARIRLFQAPLQEWVIQCFLEALEHLVKRGVRFDDIEKEEEKKNLRGRLNLAKQLRQHPGKQHIFQIRHHVFLPDRPENRLLKTALDKICTHTKNPENWRLAHTLVGMLAEIPASSQIQLDFRLWKTDRLMAHYQAIKPWCQLILGNDMPLTIRGDWQGISLLFPMERLFEYYVFDRLRYHLPEGAKLKRQVSSRYLCEHNGSEIFQLKPDMLLESGKQEWVMDTKWKLINENDRSKNYELDYGDFYQLFAYGHKYLDGDGDLFLIYPKTKKFENPLPPFKFSDNHRLWVVPFDLENDELLLPQELSSLF